MQCTILVYKAIRRNVLEKPVPRLIFGTAWFSLDAEAEAHKMMDLYGGTLDGSLCYAGEVPERSTVVSPGGLLEGSGGRTAAQYHGQLGDPQRPLIQAVV